MPELGYGKAVHHVLRQVAEHVRRHGAKPTPKQLERLFDDGFYLPAANKAGHAEMKRGRARSSLQRYLDDWGDDLLGSGRSSGRSNSTSTARPWPVGPTSSSTSQVGRSGSQSWTTRLQRNEGEQHEFQLQVYTDAGRREGLTVERAFVHDLRNAKRIAVAVDETEVEEAEGLVLDLVGRLKARSFEPRPEVERCGRCDVRAMCKERARG